MSTTVTPTLTCYEQPMLVRPELRHLTPTECERLQGFPDGWNQWGLDETSKQVEMTDRARYRQLGNAVSVPVAEWIAQRLKRAITESTKEKSQIQFPAPLGSKPNAETDRGGGHKTHRTHTV